MTRFTCNLPKELLVEILSQLPPKSLMRLKCVSKSWYVFIKNLIKDPTFVAKHLQNSISSTYMLFGTSASIIYCKDPDTPKFSLVEFSLFDVLSDDNADDQIHFSTEKFSPLRIPMTTYISDRMGQYHCNGIFCLADFWDDAHTITLCNPAIKEFRLLPKPSHVFRNRGVGFGYDSRASDYKVVIFGYDLSKRFGAEVYSLATYSWKEISYGFDVDYVPYSGTYVYLNGIFYWFIWLPEPVIHCFNMCNEMFQTISMPGDGGYESVCTKLAVWNESVAVIYSFWDVNKGCAMFFEIWVMDNDYDGNKGSCSWNKVFTVGPLMGVNDV